MGILTSQLLAQTHTTLAVETIHSNSAFSVYTVVAEVDIIRMDDVCIHDLHSNDPVFMPLIFSLRRMVPSVTIFIGSTSDPH